MSMSFLKKILFIIFIIISATPETVFSQPNTLWTKTFGGLSIEFGISVQETSDGGFIITGSTSSFGAGSDDVYLIKTDSNGDTVWTKTFGGTDSDEGRSVQQTTDGGFIITGSTRSFGAGSSDVYLIKTDSNGDTLWTKTFGGISFEFGNSVLQTTDGGYVITGPTASYAARYEDVWLIKTDSSGGAVWSKTIGGSDEDWGLSVRQTMDDGYIITGRTASFGAGSYDVYLIKTDETGEANWTKTFGGTDSDEGQSVQQTADGGFIITGETRSFGAGSVDVYLIKTDSNGDSLWTKTFGGRYWDKGFSVQQAADGGYIITGLTRSSFEPGSSDVYLIKTDSNGDTLWTKTFGGSSLDAGLSVQQTFDGGYIITGATESYGAGGPDVWLIRLAPDAGELRIDDNLRNIPPFIFLSQNYPNPFNPITQIAFDLPKQVEVTLKVYDLIGREIATLVDESMRPGYHRLSWNGRENNGQQVPSGIYIARLVTPGYSKSIKMLLLK